VQRALLTREVGAREDGYAVEPVRPPCPRQVIGRKRRASVGPDSRLDPVEDVRDADGLVGSDDIDLEARQHRLVGNETLDPASVDREQLGSEGSELESGHAAARR
jgi:hypothetical protein